MEIEVAHQVWKCGLSSAKALEFESALAQLAASCFLFRHNHDAAYKDVHADWTRVHQDSIRKTPKKIKLTANQRKIEKLRALLGEVNSQPNRI